MGSLDEYMLEDVSPLRANGSLHEYMTAIFLLSAFRAPA